MDADVVLTLLLWVSVLLAVLLVLVSAATVGRKAADLEYQLEAGVNGVRRIQAWINLRTHANRVLLGAVFLVISILLLADAPVIYRTWVNRLLFVVLLGSYTISSLVDWFDERKQVRMIQARETGGRERAYAAGAKAAEIKAEAQAEEIAQVAVVQAVPGETTPVDVATIQPDAAQAIADAVRPAVVKDTLNAIADALPERPR